MRKVMHSMLGLAAILAASSQAQVMIDPSKVTCDQWVKYHVANPKFIPMWLSGYSRQARRQYDRYSKADRRCR
jgi:hypothetical protein